VTQYFQLLRKIIGKPEDFFQGEFHQFSSQQALGFALLTAWIGASFQFAWTKLIPGPTVSFFTSYLKQLDQSIQTPSPLQEWFMQAGFLILNPFFTLYSIFFAAAIIFLIVAFRSQRSVDLQTTLKLVAFSSCASIFLILPPGLGNFVMFIFSLYLLTLGIRRIYGHSTLLSFFMAVSPSLVVVSLSLSIILVALLIAALALGGLLTLLLTL